MWIQTTKGTFSIARLPEDIEKGMLRIFSNNFDDLQRISIGYLNGIEVVHDKEIFPYYLIAPEAQISLLIAALTSDVWYGELPVAMNTLCGPEISNDYWILQKNLQSLKPLQDHNAHDNKDKEQIILEVGCEGGCLSIGMKEINGHRNYVAHVLDNMPMMLNDDGYGESVTNQNCFTHWDEALDYLSKYSWWGLSPLNVALEYRPFVKAELRKKGVDVQNSSWAFHLTSDAKYQNY